MPEMVGSARLARAFGITQRRINQLAAEGVFRGEGRPPKYDLDLAIQSYVAHCVARAEGRAAEDSDAEKKKLRAEADYKEARARQEEIRLAELEGRMHSAEDVEAAVTQLVYGVRSALLAIPGRVSVDAAGRSAAEVSEIVRREVCAALEDLSQYEYDPAAYARMVRERKGWSTDDAEVGDPEAG